MVKFDTFTKDRDWGPVALARKFFELYDTEEEGVVRSKIGTIRWDAAGDMGVVKLKLSFPAESIENDFVMDNTDAPQRMERETMVSSSKNLITSQNFSSIEELGGDAGRLGKLIEDALNEAKKSVGKSIFEFGDLEAQSQGSQYLTSYVFNYEMVIIEPQVIERATVDEVL